MMESDNKKIPNKQAYEKPRLRIIELAAEEVLGVGCKTYAGDPKGQSGAGCMVPNCFQQPGS